MTQHAICILDYETSPIIQGEIKFTQGWFQTTLIQFELYGPPFQTHAIHIHEFGDLRNGCESLGPHWNPTSQYHGSIFLHDSDRHAGDLINNITFDQNGLFRFSYYDSMVNVKDIYGRSIVIHEQPDDLGIGGNKESRITGNAGKRIACGIIARAEKM